MPKELRDRIVAALRNADEGCPPWDGPVSYDVLADAVIAELGLTEFRIEWPVRERWWATKTEPWEANDE